MVEKRAEGREGSDCVARQSVARSTAKHCMVAWYNGGAEGGEGSHATPSDADDPRGRETIRSKEDAAHTLDPG